MHGSSGPPSFTVIVRDLRYCEWSIIQQTEGITSAKKLIVACLAFSNVCLSYLSFYLTSVSDAGPRFRQKFQLIGKDAEVWFYNETAVRAKIPTNLKRQNFDSLMRLWFRQKFQLIGKDAEVWFYNETAVQAKIPIS